MKTTVRIVVLKFLIELRPAVFLEVERYFGVETSNYVINSISLL